MPIECIEVLGFATAECATALASGGVSKCHDVCTCTPLTCLDIPLDILCFGTVAAGSGGVSYFNGM